MRARRSFFTLNLIALLVSVTLAFLALSSKALVKEQDVAIVGATIVAFAKAGQSTEDRPNATMLTGGVHDFDFLAGSWNVRHRRLKTRLAGSNEWQDFGGTLVNWTTLGGQGNVGDNVMELPGGTIHGVGVRAFDEKTRQWSVWWLDARYPETIDPPTRGGFKDGIGTFLADDTFNGRPVKVRVRWSQITPTSAHWEQAYSPDGGATWEVNWTSDFTRMKTKPTTAALTGDLHDWDFLIGRWAVRHHKLKARLAGSNEWEDFAGTCVNWTTLAGQGNADDNVLEMSGGTYRGVGIRAFDPKTRHWSIWWIDSRTSIMDPPVRGGFKDGVGTFVGDDTLNGRPIKMRFRWSQITPTTAHWEQAFSPDGGVTWETNWLMEFTRVSP